MKSFRKMIRSYNKKHPKSPLISILLVANLPFIYFHAHYLEELQRWLYGLAQYPIEEGGHVWFLWVILIASVFLPGSFYRSKKHSRLVRWYGLVCYLLISAFLLIGMFSYVRLEDDLIVFKTFWNRQAFKLAEVNYIEKQYVVSRITWPRGSTTYACNLKHILKLNNEYRFPISEWVRSGTKNFLHAIYNPSYFDRSEEFLRSVYMSASIDLPELKCVFDDRGICAKRGVKYECGW